MQDGPATSEESLFLTKLPLPYDSAIMLFFCLLKGVENLGPQTQEERNGNPLQYSCLENPMDGEAPVGYIPWGHKESDTTKWSHTHTHKTAHRFA